MACVGRSGRARGDARARPELWLYTWNEGVSPRMSWKFGTGGCVFFESGAGGCVHVWAWSRYSARDGWKTDRNTALCWECNLAWIKSSFPGSCSTRCRLPGNGIFFFSLSPPLSFPLALVVFKFSAGKVFAERNQMRYFFPIECLKVLEAPRQTRWKQKKAHFWRQRHHIFVSRAPNPHPFAWTPCWTESRLLVK